MSLLPLALSAHASAWNPAGVPQPGEGPPSGPGKPDAACRFCGLPAGGWQEDFHLDGNHQNPVPANIVAACPLCHLCQHMDRPTIQQEAALIWLPEMSQAAVIALARHVHLLLHRHGEPADMQRGRPRRNIAALYPAWAAFEALRARGHAAEERLGTASPRDLAAALLGFTSHAWSCQDALLRGLRLLPLGRLFHAGRDVYPHMLQSWANGADAAGSSR